MINSDYTAPFLFRNGHIHSIYPTLFRHVKEVVYRRERIDTPDQDFLDLDWSTVGSDSLAIISHGLPFTRIEAFTSESGERDLLLEDDQGGLAGLLSLNDLGKREEFEHVSALLLADDLVNRRTIYLSPQDNLIRALEFFGESEFDKLPIVDSSAGTDKLLGYVRYRDIIAFYQAEHDSPVTQSLSPST